ncbi:MAG: hypothetical protein ACFFDS_02655 [Candidatus Thorarchaeota archaeon]
MIFIELIYLITAFILFLTFIAIVYYAWETQKLRKAIVKQTELSLRPLVTINFEKGEFCLHNIGNSPALNITIDTLKDSQSKLYEFSPVVLLDSKEFTSRILFQKINLEKNQKLLKQGLEQIDIPDEFSLTIHYENIENKCFYSKVTIFQKEFVRTRFLETGKVLG